MSSGYHQLLDATIQHLQELKTRGVRFVPVAPETLAALNQAGRERPTLRPAPPPVAPPVPRAAPIPPKPAEQRPAIEQALALPLGNEISAAVPAVALSPDAKAAAFMELRQRALACVKCPHLASSRKNVVFGVGSLEAELMFIGEAPGADEDEQGEPFVGKAGQLLTKIIQAMGLTRERVYIGNILKC